MSTPPPKKQSRFSTGAIALSLTCLLLGVFATYSYRAYEEKNKLQNREFLEKQLLLLDGEGGKPKQESVRPPATIGIDSAYLGELPSIRRFNGRLLEIRNTTLSSEVTGLVLDMPVEVGDFVKEGETLIAKIDDTWTKFTYETAIREIELRTSVLEYEMSETKRLQDLVEIRAISQSEYLLQVNKTDQIRTNLEIAKIVREESSEKLKRTVIHAPFDGFIITKMTEVGSLLTPGSPIVQIVSAGEIDAVFMITQSIVNRLAIDDEITIGIERSRHTVKGKVHSIVPHAASVGPRAFPVHIRIPNEHDRLKSGMAVYAMVPESDPKPGVIVPVQAILDKPDGRTVWVALSEPAQEGRPARVTVQPVPVKLLAHAVVICSVEPETGEGKKLLGDKAQVVIDGAERLTPGQVVAIREVDPKYLENLPTGSGHAVVREPGEQ